MATANDEALLVSYFGHLPYFRQVGREWKASCPRCGDSGHEGPGDPDRFFINLPDSKLDCVRGKCRVCGYFEVARDERMGRTLDERTRIQMIEERNKERERRNAEIARKRRELTTSGAAIKFHRDMSFAQRNKWYGTGLDDKFINMFRLGYTEARHFGVPANPVVTDALTIPFWEGSFEDVANIQFRLQNYPDGFGKYRTYPGLSVPLFKTMPDEPIQGDIILVEGAKKAMVLAKELWASREINIIAVPSKMPSEELLAELAPADRVFIMLDPDAYTPAKDLYGHHISPSVDRATRILYENNSEQQILSVKLPVKVDDFFVVYGYDVDMLRNFFYDAERVTHDGRSTKSISIYT